MSRILGIDVGTAIMGWSIMEKDPQSRNGLKLVDYGAVITEPDHSTAYRLQEMYEKLGEVIEHYQPQISAVESLFFSKNQKTAMTVSQGRGVILLRLQQAGIEIFEYTPLQVKVAVTGYGKSDKKQVQLMVKAILGMAEIPKPDDAADAIAIAICHLNTKVFNDTMLK